MENCASIVDCIYTAINSTMSYVLNAPYDALAYEQNETIVDELKGQAMIIPGLANMTTNN